MTEVKWLTPTEAAAWSAVRELGRPLWTALGRDLQRGSDLSMADYEVLVVLSEAPEGPVSYRVVAEVTGWEKSRLSHHLTRMERRGLVRREGCTEDRRSANICLTEVGRTAIEAAAPGHVAAVRRLLIDVLSEEDMTTLIAIAERVAAAIDG